MRQAAFLSDNNYHYRQLLEIIVRENKPLAAKRRDIIV